MKATILSVYLLTLQQLKCSRQSTIIDQSIQDLVQTTKPLDVQFILQNSFEASPKAVTVILRTLSRLVPTSCVCVGNSTSTELPFSFISPTTLILYLYVSKRAPDVQQTDTIVRAIARCDNRPRVLLVTLLEEQDCDFELFLKQMWSENFIDATVLELSELDGQVSNAKVHRYNPFASVYERQPFRPPMQWFPDKLGNLHGHPLNVFMVNRTGYLSVIENSNDQQVAVEGPDAKIVRTFAEVMNFTVEPYLRTDKQQIFNVMSNGDVDIAIPMFPYFSSQMFHRVEHTLPLDVESWCTVVPIIYKYKRFEVRAFIGIVINCCFVLVFWLTSRLLKFDSRSWRPLKIFAVLIAASSRMKPRTMTEKVVFFNVLLVSAMYSATLYADLTAVSLEAKTEMEYNNFGDLDKSGLTPMVFDVMFNITFFSDDQSFLALKRKAIPVTSWRLCWRYLVTHRNVTCLMELEMARTLFYSHVRQGMAVMKVLDNLCYSKPASGYFLKAHSPYKERFEQIILLLESAGIRKKWQYDFAKKLRPRKTHTMKVDHLKRSSLPWNLICIAGCGYTIAFCIFLGEIMTNRTKRRESF